MGVAAIVPTISERCMLSTIGDASATKLERWQRIIVEAAEQTGAIVTAENHNIYGGLGSAVAEALAENAPAPMTRIGIRDRYGECGANADLLCKYEMSPQHIAEAARSVIGRKP